VEFLDTFPLPFKDESFEVVFITETIEHILPDNLIPNLNELYRMLKTDGYVIVTTPNGEILEKGTIICPDCGCIFHQGQHLSAWTADSLSALMANIHFRTIVCRTTHFRSSSKLNFLRDLIARVREYKKMNLVYIGQK
jgi:ubiquinone/menaquinone biosynthesis C-methylase UbiE